jgi:hypothetical protein
MDESGATGFFVSRRALARSRAELAPRHSGALANRGAGCRISIGWSRRLHDVFGRRRIAV